ncbi:unnamed protein product [Adineta steineri]|uniref:Uncharacterized protein n=1 Tax=Adineta steineri TaxID=433720 RepID=A0A820G1Q8_9BILA|nr:unnamed protein product [Adineta steineri]
MVDQNIEGLCVGGIMDVCGGATLHIYNIDDSRCAANATCFWAGEAKVKLLLSNNAGSSVVDLIVGKKPQNSAQVTLGTTVYTITLDDVVPYPTIPMNSGASEALVQHLSLIQRPLSVQISINSGTLIFIIGLISGILPNLTLKIKSTQKIGCDVYLFT